MNKFTDVYINGGNLGEKGGYHSFPTDVVAVAVDYNEDNTIQFVFFDDKAQFIKTKDLEVIEYV